MTEDLRDKLLADIAKTGYPVELQVGDMISKYATNVYYNTYYLDRDEQKGKEVDVSAYFHSHSEKVVVGLDLICEVKKSSKRPWVIFSTKRGFIENEGYLRLHYSTEVDANILPFEEMQRNCSSSGFLRIGRSYHEGFKSEGEKSQIFKALVTVIKASEDCLERSRVSGDDFTVPGHKKIVFIEPIIIVDGLLYEAYLDERSETELNEIGHIPVSFGYISSEYDRRHYLVDVVTMKEFPNLLAMKKNWIDGIRAIIEGEMSLEE